LAKKTKTNIDDTAIKMVSSLRPPFYLFLAFYVSLQFLKLDSFLQSLVNIVLIIWLILQAISAAEILVDFFIRRLINKKDEEASPTTVTFLRNSAKAIIWGLGLLMILSNLGVNINSLIAIALQNILSDLFSSFAIAFDKPFVKGDFIIVGDKLGVVKKVGIKTTRIQSLQGEEIVLPNQKLTSSEIQNFRKMEERRVLFTFGVLYSTPLSKLRKIPKIIEEIISTVKLTKFDRAHFLKFDDSSLTFEVVYFIKSPDYNKYMDANQEIHFKIAEEFASEKIEFAFPTQTIHIVK
jgi:small-conductance mechanosensitive channel